MSLKFDRFTWSVLLLVLLLLVGAIVTVAVTGDRGADTELTYVEEDSPDAAVQNAYIALLKGDTTRARQYYSTEVLEDDTGPDFENRVQYRDERNQRLRILSVDMEEEDRATVEIAIDYYSPGGLFDRGSSYSNHQTLTVIREDGRWVVDTPTFF